MLEQMKALVNLPSSNYKDLLLMKKTVNLNHLL